MSLSPNYPSGIKAFWRKKQKEMIAEFGEEYSKKWFRENAKEWYENNTDRKKIYYHQNREKLKKRSLDYYYNNIEYFKEKRRQYYLKKKELMNKQKDENKGVKSP